MAFRINCPITKSDEEWKGIRGFIKYEISNKGRVRNADTYQLMKVAFLHGKYPYLKLYNTQGIQKQVGLVKTMKSHWGKTWDPEEAANAR